VKRALHIDPGHFRTTLALEAASRTSDGMGGEVENWATVATIFAHIEPLSAKSVHGAGQMLETVTHLITLRRGEDVKSGMRFTSGARSFDILTVIDPDETGRYFQCESREVGR
jgi:SPP1 family predicted phage head-tail adaptor